jgi:hypothetical protein
VTRSETPWAQNIRQRVDASTAMQYAAQNGGARQIRI